MQRARWAGNTQLEQEILNTRDPSLHKRIGKTAKITQRQWLEEKAKSVMIDALEAKFDAHPDLAMYLMQTADKQFVECNKHDSDWGIGVELNSGAKGKPEDWKGHNWLGECLMEVRKKVTV